MSDLPQTERTNPQSKNLDLLATPELVALLVTQQREAVDAVASQSGAIAAAVETIADRLRRGGRLHYVGAGTSGRLGTLDAAEMVPTFGTLPDLVCAHIAGGANALTRAIEGAEDDAIAGEREMHSHVRADDAVVGISASGSAAYVTAALAAARAIGAFTLALVNAEPSAMAAVAERTIVLATGSEPLTGSTRLKAGTSQKIALNALSTAVMVRLGKVYDNLMVDVVATNRKLRERAVRLVRALTDLDDEAARDLLSRADGSVKVAVVMAQRNVSADEARQLLAARSGFLRELL
jgi:N-acetylmuramic acid 6-phosphate etherase